MENTTTENTDKTDKPKVIKFKAETEEGAEVYYVVNIYDNHGKIYILQSGKPDPPPPPPPYNP